MNHLVLFSGGIGSWVAAKRIAEQHGTERLTLLFTDTKMEDEDLYRFLRQAAANVGGELVEIADGRTPWEVFTDTRYLGNSRIDPCSRILKRDLARKWIEERFKPEEVTVYLGIDWTESHRYEAAKRRWLPYHVEAPLCDPPYMMKADLHAWAEREGLQQQRLYRLGYPHANCGGFCVKAGLAHFKHLYETLPDRYAYHEAQEEVLREHLGKDVTILRDRQGGGTRPITLRELREKIESNGQLDLLDWGGCGCFSDETLEATETSEEAVNA